ncbi:MAG TPA: SAM-dependent chlorinase/fluorinase [Verrucomicrobiae bacterium]|nr:SAM-dependent chlorinase/fluorinase [Verrucomicrobiae bacterium]
MPLVTLITDFGTRDWFVGSMKGVILGLNPRATIVDITHEIPAGDIRAGAFALVASYRCFPSKTIHVAIVDPGVGSSRSAIAAKTADYIFVGPDNGVLSFALAREKVMEIRRLDNENYLRKPVSATFHGRDVFAPVAAHLTQEIRFDSLGEKLADCVRLDFPQARAANGEVLGEIIYIDHFGNAITNIEFAATGVETAVPSGKAPGRRKSVAPTKGLSRTFAKARVPGKLKCGIKRFYQDVPPGQPLAMISSSGFLEIAVNRGSAASQFGLKIGDAVEVE